MDNKLTSDVRCCSFSKHQVKIIQQQITVTALISKALCGLGVQ